MKRHLKQLLQLTVLSLLICITVLSIAANALTGSGTEADPYLIKTADDLDEFRDIVNGGDNDAWGTLLSDIDLSQLSDVAERENWTPIGYYVNAGTSSLTGYDGRFDGRGYTIRNLRINSPTEDYIGLFGHVYDHGEIVNLSVSGSVTGNNYVGGIIGHVGGSPATNSTFRLGNCTYSGIVTGNERVGGISGSVGYCLLANLSSAGSVTGNETVGGVVGQNGNGATLICCTNSSSVTGNEKVGGIVGYNDNITVNCSNSGNVSGTSYIGGITGYNYTASIANCSNSGNVSGTLYFHGGIAGYNFDAITNCGWLEGTHSIGIGKEYGTVTNVYTFRTEQHDSIVTTVIPSIDKTILDLDKQETATITFSTYPSQPANRFNATSGFMRNIQASSDSAECRIDQNSGTITVTPTRGGIAEITVTADLYSTDFSSIGNYVAEPTQATFKYYIAVYPMSVPVTGITVSPSSLSLNVGATSTLTATVSPSNATNKSYSWSSNNTGVATVNSSGLVTAKANGTATITATTADGAKTSSCTVVVTTPTSGITVSPTTATIIKGKTQQLTATVAPSTASDKSVTWSSSNAAIASVSTSGLVTAKAAGTATITATSSGGHKAECKVTVRVPVTGVTLSSTSLSLIKGNSRQLTATVAPSDASTKTVTWTSTDKSVATVSSAGIVAAVGGGSATITATTSDGSYTASCAVTVTVPVEGVKFNDISANVGMGSTTKLNYTITPSDATNKTVTWQSSDTAVATVDKSSGVITPVAPGGTEITVTTEDGGYSDTTLLMVTNALKTVKLKLTTESGKFPSFATAYYKSSGNVTEYPGIPVTSEGEIDVNVPVTHSNYKLGISHINSLIAGMEIASTTTDATSSPLNMIEGDFNADNIINGTDWTIIVQRMNYGGGETQYGLTGDMNYDGKVDDLDLLLFNAPISFTGAPRFLTSGFDMAASAKAADTAELAENSYDYQFAVGTAFDLYAEETPDEATVADDSVISDTPPLQSIIRLTELKTIGRERRYEVTLSEPSGAINMFQLALDGSVSEITYALPEGFEIIGSGEKDGITVIAIGTQHEGGLSIPANTPFITLKAAAMPGVLYGENYTTMLRATESDIETLSLETGSNGATVATDSSSGGGCNAGAAAAALLAFAPFIIHKSYRNRRNHK